jgi:hypothetical protein
MEIQKKYNELAKKHKLPEYSAINHDFEICTIENEDFLLREVRRKIVEKIDKFLPVLDSVLMPDTNIADMQECHVFTDKQKAKMYELYKKMMHLQRYSFEVAIDEAEESSAAYIKEAFESWQSIKKELKTTIATLKDSWKQDTDINEVLSYMG